MREKDRMLRRRRQRRNKRLKYRAQEAAAVKPERQTGSKRAVKKTADPATPAEGGASAEAAPEKKKPAAKKAPAKSAEPQAQGGGANGGGEGEGA